MEKIVSTASDMFMQYGFKSVTMDDIANELGMSKKTLYNRFANKEGLIEESMNFLMEKVDDVIEHIRKEKRNPIDELMAIRDSIKKIIPAEQQSACIFQLNKYYPEIFNHWQDVQIEKVESKIIDNIQRGKELELYRSEIDELLFSKFYFLGIALSKDERIFAGYNPSEVKDEYLVFFLRGICTQKGLELLQTKID